MKRVRADSVEEGNVEGDVSRSGSADSGSDESGSSDEDSHIETMLDAMSVEERGAFIKRHPRLLSRHVMSLSMLPCILECPEGKVLVNWARARKHGNTHLLPLWRACMQYPTMLVSMLLEAGANPWLFDCFNRPLAWCLNYGEYGIISDRGKPQNKRIDAQIEVNGLAPNVALLQDYMRQWNAQLHTRFPRPFRDAIFTLLLCNRRCFGLAPTAGHRLSRDVLFKIIALLAHDYGTYRRDAVCKRTLSRDSTVRHLILMLYERGQGWNSHRSSREKLIKLLREYARVNGPE